jgi:excisionase family DNA binding protein
MESDRNRHSPQPVSADGLRTPRSRPVPATGSLRWIVADRARAARLTPHPRGPAIKLTLELAPDQLAELALRVADLLSDNAGGPATLSPYLTVAEAAEYLRCSRERIHALLTQRRLARHKDGGRTLVLRAELEPYVRSATERRRAA